MGDQFKGQISELDIETPGLSGDVVGSPPSLLHGLATYSDLLGLNIEDRLRWVVESGALCYTLDNKQGTVVVGEIMQVGTVAGSVLYATNGNTQWAGAVAVGGIKDNPVYLAVMGEHPVRCTVAAVAIGEYLEPSDIPGLARSNALRTISTFAVALEAKGAGSIGNVQGLLAGIGGQADNVVRTTLSGPSYTARANSLPIVGSTDGRDIAASASYCFAAAIGPEFSNEEAGTLDVGDLVMVDTVTQGGCVLATEAGALKYAGPNMQSALTGAAVYTAVTGVSVVKCTEDAVAIGDSLRVSSETGLAEIGTTGHLIGVATSSKAGATYGTVNALMKRTYIGGGGKVTEIYNNASGATIELGMLVMFNDAGGTMPSVAKMVPGDGAQFMGVALAQSLTGTTVECQIVGICQVIFGNNSESKGDYLKCDGASDGKGSASPVEAAQSIGILMEAKASGADIFAQCYIYSTFGGT